MFSIRINFNTVDYLRNQVFLKNRASFLLSKELRHRDKIKRTYY
jgi:hypothetical protein